MIDFTSPKGSSSSAVALIVGVNGGEKVTSGFVIDETYRSRCCAVCMVPLRFLANPHLTGC
jgi:hypothetical protein